MGQTCVLWWKILIVRPALDTTSLSSANKCHVRPDDGNILCINSENLFLKCFWFCWGGRYWEGVFPTCANNEIFFHQSSMQTSPTPMLFARLLLYTCIVLWFRGGVLFRPVHPPCSPLKILLASHQIRRLPVIFCWLDSEKICAVCTEAGA